MTVTSALLSFAVVAGLLTIVPGLDTALVLRAAIVKGSRHAFVTALGVGTGALIWGVAAAVGVSALLLASTVAYTIVRIAGALYLILIGVLLVRKALADNDADLVAADDSADASSVWQSWRQGLLTNLLNPKIGAFYLAVLPQFLPANTSHLLMGLLLALVHDLEGLIWFSAIILTAARARAWLSEPVSRRIVDGVAGALIVGFGVTLGLAAR